MWMSIVLNVLICKIDNRSATILQWLSVYHVQASFLIEQLKMKVELIRIQPDENLERM